MWQIDDSVWWGSDAMAAENRELFVEGLMKTYGPELTNLAYTYVHDWGRAEEIVQDVFFKCFLKMDTFRGEAAIKTWLYRITINRCKDVLRLRSFHLIQPHPNNFVFSYDYRSTSVEDEVIRHSEEAQMINMILTLPVKYREVIILYYYSDASVNEMSDMIGKNSKTVRTRLRRARMMLEQMLKEVDEDGR